MCSLCRLNLIEVCIQFVTIFLVSYFVLKCFSATILFVSSDIQEKLKGHFNWVFSECIHILEDLAILSSIY